MEPFKNRYNKKSVTQLARFISSAGGASFDETAFLKQVLPELKDLEMKDRVRLISAGLKDHLTKSYAKNTKILIKALAPESSLTGLTEESPDGVSGFLTWPLLQYVEEYGLEDFESSFRAMHEMTKRFSAEFAIRPFLIKDDKRVFSILEEWAQSSNYHVRRLCSEGIRPNLPWGLKVPAINKNLKRSLKLIDSLKDDSEEYVRRSVANHLNDISHLDEELMLKTAKKWSKGKASSDRLWVVRHATRTLLKKGHPEALKLHGYDPKAPFKISSFVLDKKSLKEGESLVVSLKISNGSSKAQKVLLDAVVHFLKSDGSHSPKVFRLKDFTLKAGEEKLVEKKLSFKKVTTRKHYSGQQKLSLQVNGAHKGKKTFNLKVP